MSRKRAGPTVGEATQGLLAAVMEDSITEINRLLRENTAKILPALRIIRSDDLVPKQESEQVTEDKPFHSSYTKLQRLPKEYARELLTLEANNPEITAETFERLERATDGATRAAFYYAHHVLPPTPWPRFALNREVFAATFKMRHKAIGNRLETMPLKTSGDDLLIDWNSWGVYKLFPPGDVAKTEVRHIALGKSAPLAPITIAAGADYQLLNNWDSAKAQLKYHNLVTPLLNMFDPAVKREIEGLRVGAILLMICLCMELCCACALAPLGHRACAPRISWFRPQFWRRL